MPVYLAVIALTMFVLPIVSIVIDYAAGGGGQDLVTLTGKWFVFWAVGVRLLTAGLRQTLDPAFTARAIFDIEDKAAEKIVRELGFGNLAIGVLGVISSFDPAWVLPAAITGALFFGLAGAKHVLNRPRTRLENIAMVSDLFVFAVLLLYAITRLASVGTP
jgi:hypothetical protein